MIDKDPIDNAIEVLNRIHKADPTILQTLIFTRVPCNETLAKDPTVQVGCIDSKWPGTEPKEWEVGILGIINGLFGVDDRNIGYIAADLDNEGNIINFTRIGFKDDEVYIHEIDTVKED